MARKPNYRFERHERERIKAAKKAARAEAKAEKTGTKPADPELEPSQASAGDDGGASSD